MEKTSHSATLSPGECFGEMALLNHTTCNATVRCIEAMDVLSLPKSELSLLAANLPSVREGFEKVMEQRKKANEKALSGTTAA